MTLKRWNWTVAAVAFSHQPGLLHQLAHSENPRSRLIIGAKLLDRRLHFRHVGVHLGLVLELKSDHLVDQVQGQSGILVVQHLGRVSFVVEEHNEVQVDAMSRQADLTLGPSRQQVG
jgi:hypothetical protein